MGDLFVSFNPQTVVILEFPGNWISAVSVLLILPQSYWVMSGQYEVSFRLVMSALLAELRAVLGSMISPGTYLMFMGVFMAIIFTNIFGLAPYVFTASSHLSFTLSLALPLWLGKMILSGVKQMNFNLAHLVPEGTPGPLMPVMVLIETVSLLIRPGTLAVRLAANMVAGHLLLTLLGSQGPMLGGAALVGLMGGLVLLVILECAVACIQAYVFTILSSLYLAEHSSMTLSSMGVK